MNLKPALYGLALATGLGLVILWLIAGGGRSLIPRKPAPSVSEEPEESRKARRRALCLKAQRLCLDGIEDTLLRIEWNLERVEVDVQAGSIAEKVEIRRLAEFRRRTRELQGLIEEAETIGAAEVPAP